MKKLLTIDQLAEQIQMSKSTIYKWTMANKIPHIKIDSAVRFDPNAIEKWLRARTIEPSK